MKFGALLVTGADGVPRQYDLDAPSVLVGSGVGSGGLLSDASVAERHAKLVVESGVLLVEDMGSESGTAVSGRRVTPHVPNRVEPGQELRFGSVSALYLEPPPMEVEPLPGMHPEAAGEDEADFRPFSRVLLTPFAPQDTTYRVEITNAKGGGTAAVIHVYDKDGNLRVQHEEGTGNQTVTVQVG